MKNLIIRTTFILAFLISITPAFSQTLIVEKDKVSYEDQVRPSIKVTMNAHEQKVRNDWEDWLEEKYDAKVRGNGMIGKKDVIRAKEVSIPAISDKKIDLYAEIVEKGKGTQMNVFASFGYDMNITPTSHPVQYQALEKFTMKFVSELLTDFYKDNVEEAEEVVSDLQDDKNDLQKDLSDNKQKITDLQQENIELDKNIASTSINLDDATRKLKKSKEERAAIAKKLEKEKTMITTSMTKGSN